MSLWLISKMAAPFFQNEMPPDGGKKGEIMKPVNFTAIHHSFEIQAENFESAELNFTKEEYLKYTLSRVAPDRKDMVLEVAAGTCACGRSFAPLAHTVVCLDATLPMLAVGKEKADSDRMDNMIFMKGCAEELPFLNENFDIVFSRLAFHHFPDADAAFSEMVRVLRPGGKLVLIDVEAAEEELRDTEDKIETLRDPSHIKNMSRSEMLKLFAAHGLSVESCEKTEMRQKLKNWLALTKTPQDIQDEITERMKNDMRGKEKTGFFPYMENDEICFDQRWILIIGRKKQ